MFDEHEKINVGHNQITDVVVELQDYRLLADETNESQWDLMGTAYEEYTATYLKKKRGQFFTNRLIIDLLVKMTNPNPDEIILDPAGGSGGFVTATMRHVHKLIENSERNEIAKRRAEATLRTNLFMVEISKRLVKVAKTAMILNGDGHAGFTQGNSLGEFNELDPIILSKARKNMPKVILTNPPWAGVGEGRITDKRVLERFQIGKVWKWEQGKYKPTSELLKDGVPPELLFLERCIDWLAPGGRLGIVLPKGVLDTDTALAARQFLFQNSKLLSVINCHKNTFQPFTGPRPCLIVLEKRSHPVSLEEIEDYPIFMAISRKIGQDSEGVPTYKIDDIGNETDDLDHDLDEIFDDFVKLKEGNLRESEYIFSVNFSNLEKGNLRCNPQAFLPSLNDTIKKILEIDGINGWSVEELLHIYPHIKIFKPPRLKSENLVIEDPKDKSNLEPYYTPSTLLQNKSESVKWFDLTKANSTQLRTIKILRLKANEILISRSGSIGRVIYVTKRFEGVIGSDDLIRVQIPDEKLRYYVYQYLRSKAGQDQMKKNEYGSIQQHLEAPHIRRILIPIPDNFEKIDEIIQKSKNSICMHQDAYEIDIDAQKNMSNLLAFYGINGE